MYIIGKRIRITFTTAGSRQIGRENHCKITSYSSEPSQNMRKTSADRKWAKIIQTYLYKSSERFTRLCGRFGIVGHNSALCSKHKMKQNKNYKNDERANGIPKTVAATMVADNGIRETYMMCKELCYGINSKQIEIKTNISKRGNVNNGNDWQKEMWKPKYDFREMGKPDVLLNVKGIADLVTRNSINHPPLSEE
ncbi:hypothetical protein DINM_002929 [Dirofilaria immitis]|nr:hypothetical protein [Dirofilaria immitis]